jgi:hypothetical protein
MTVAEWPHRRVPSSARRDSRASLQYERFIAADEAFSFPFHLRDVGNRLLNLQRPGGNVE